MPGVDRFTDAWTKAGLGAGDAALARLRKEGIDRFAAKGWPTPRHEDWKYTSLASLARADLDPLAPPGAVPADVPSLPETYRIVLVDGRLKSADVGEGVRVLSLKDVAHLDVVRKHLGAHVDTEDAPAALNAAFLEDGVFLEIPPGTILSKPIHLVHLSTGGGKAVHPRVLVLAGVNSQTSLVEQWVGTGAHLYGAGQAGASLVNVVVEIVLEDGAHLRHTQIQAESPETFHLAAVGIEQAPDSKYRGASFAVGGALSRTSVRTALDQGAETELDGLYLARKNVHDHHTLVDHTRPHGRSRELFKGIVAEGGRGVFTGKVLVREGAQKTDSAQSVRNLLVADDAIADARPQLEIFADDVKCAHGAAIGKLDEESLFYLRTRGIGLFEARRLLTWAFASEVVGLVEDGAVRHAVDELVHAWLARLGGIA